MAVIYLRSTDGLDTDNGSTWALAKATLGGAFAAMVAGDTVWVSQVHAESQASAMTLTSPGTPGNPCKVLCVNDAVEPPTTLATTAVIKTTGVNTITIGGSAYFYGIKFLCGEGSTSAASLFYIGTNISTGQVYESCILELGGTAGASYFRMGQDINRDSLIQLINTILKFNSSAEFLLMRNNIVWIGGSLDGSVAVPGYLFMAGTPAGQLIVQGVDLSALNTYLVYTGGQSPFDFYIRNCKLHPSVAAKTAAAITSPGAEKIFIDISDSGDTNYKIDHRKYQGSIVTETVIKRTAGASDGTTAYCWKMVSLATPQFFWPLESPPIAIWNETVGSAKSLTVEILHDSLTALKDDEIWVEVEYLGTTGFPKSLLASDRKADIMAAGADQAASTEAWTTTGLTNPNKQKLVATFTPQEKGPFAVHVMLAKASYTVYVCPKVAVV